MGHFVLLPGAWLEGHVFDRVVDGLRARDHHATAVTFPGLVDLSMGEPDLESWINAAADMISGRASEHVLLVGYILCTESRSELPAAVADRVERSDWTLKRLATGHWPMVSHPEELVALLHDIASDS